MFDLEVTQNPPWFQLSAVAVAAEVTWPPPQTNSRVGGYDFLGGEAEAAKAEKIDEDWHNIVLYSSCMLEQKLKSTSERTVHPKRQLSADRQAILLIARGFGKFEFAMKDGLFWLSRPWKIVHLTFEKDKRGRPFVRDEKRIVLQREVQKCPTFMILMFVLQL